MGRRFLSLVLAACLLAASLPVLGISPAVAASTGWSVPASAPAAFTVGVDGTTASAGRFGNPYAVSTAQQLADLAYFVNSGYSAYSTSYFRLTADIVLNGSVLKPDGSLDAGSSPTAWTPIGVRGSQNYGYFSGYFDGNGHSVRGVYIDGGSDDQGLFGYVKDGTITNLTLEDSYIRGDENVGGIVGSTENQKYSLTTVRNCTSAATVVGARQVGGIVGSDAGNYDVVDQCTFLGLAEGVSTGENIGGIVGSASGTSVTSCAGAGLVRGNRSVGGIVGYSTRSTILHDTHTGTAVGVSGAAAGSANDSEGIGGIVGTAANDGTVTGCRNAGAVSGGRGVGGIQGNGIGGSAIRQSWNSGPSRESRTWVASSANRTATSWTYTTQAPSPASTASAESAGTRIMT